MEHQKLEPIVSKVSEIPQASNDVAVNLPDSVSNNLGVENVILEGSLTDEEEEEEDDSFEVTEHDSESFSLFSLFRKGAVNLILPFINGVMLGFGEILAHELGFRYGWAGAKVQPPRRLERARIQQSKFL